MTELERQSWLRAAAELPLLPSAADRARRVRELAARFAVTPKTAYERLQRAGYVSGRAPRKDKGTSCLSRADLEQTAAIVASSINKRGQVNTPVTEAREISRDLGLPAGNVSSSHLRRLLDKEGLGLRQMRAPEASVAQRSLYPNDVWFFDISVAIQWYFRDEKGKRLDLYTDAGARWYAGKFENYRALKRVIHRFVLTDHCSGAYFVRYYYSPGERWEDVADFLQLGMADKGEMARVFPMRGRPHMLVADQGPANKAAYTKELCKALNIELHLHGAGNAKMSGSVETRHGHWQKSFEGRLGVDHGARDLDDLNRLAMIRCADLNAHRPHTRTGKTPMRSWLSIPQSRLREAPDRDTFFGLVTGAPHEATLDNYLRLSNQNRKWQVGGLNVHPKQKVTFRLAPYSPAGIRVWDQWGRELSATELTFDANGFATNGTHHTFLSEDPAEQGATAPTTPGQRIAKRVAEDRSSVQLGDVWKAAEDRLAATTFLSPRGEEWAPKVDDALAAEPPLADLDVLLEVAQRLGRPLEAEEADWWKARTLAGLTSTSLDQVYRAWLRGEDDTAAAIPTTG